MNQLKTSAVLVLGGGVALLISTLLDWYGVFGLGWNVYESALFGLNGIFLLVISLAVIGVVVVRNFVPNVELPSRVLGLTLDVIVLKLGFASFVLGFSLMFIQNSKFGSILAAIAGAMITVGAYLDVSGSRG
jgi:hypothetical protein